MSTPLLEVSGLCARHRAARALPWSARSTQVLHEVSLSLGRGRTLALVGESGSGKSTLARVVAGLHPASAGHVSLDGRPLDTGGRRWPLALRRRVQMVFQDSLAALDGRMRIGDILEEPLRIHRVGDVQARAQRVLRLLADVGLPADYARRFPHQLSGGQRQRIGIARALALEPELLILDEPVSALDVSIQAQILNLLADLRRLHRLSCLFITHDMAVVRHVADDIAVMQAGRLVEQGDCAQVLAAPRHAYTRTLLAAVPGRTLAPIAAADALPPPARCRSPAMHAGALARLALYRSRQAPR